MKPSKLILDDRPGAGLEIRAFLHEEVPCVEFTLCADRPQVVLQTNRPFQRRDGTWGLVGYEPWIQFEPTKWSEMQKELFQQMVDAWNEKYATD